MKRTDWFLWPGEIARLQASRQQWMARAIEQRRVAREARHRILQLSEIIARYENEVTVIDRGNIVHIARREKE